MKQKLLTLLTLLCLSVTVWGAVSATHSPGTYTKATASGGYGLTLASYNDGSGARNYEVYYFSWKSSKMYLAAGSSYGTDANAFCLISNVANNTTDGVDFSDNWGNVISGSLSGSNTSPAAEWAVASASSSTHYVPLTNTSSITLKISGYDQFSFAGRDNHATTSGKQLTVTIDGVDQTFDHSATDWTVYRFDISTGEHTIVISGNGTDANRVRGFSLRVPSAPATPTFSPASGEVEQGKTVSVTSSNADNIYYAWSASESEPATPASWSYVAATAGVGNVPVPGDVTGTRYLYAYGKNDATGTIAHATYTIVAAKTPTTLAFNNPTTSVAEGSSVTNVATLSPTIDGAAITYSSDDESIATVDENTGEVTGVAAGSTTIRANYAGNSTYSSSTANYTITVLETWTRHANHTLPTTVLDLSNAVTASTALNINWAKDRPYFGNDGADNYVVLTPYTIYQQQVTWSLPTSANSGTDTWSATDIFKGSSYYTQESNKARYATIRSDRVANYYRYRVTGVSKVKLLCKANSKSVTLGAFLVTAGVAANKTLLFTRDNSSSAKVLTLDGLDPASEYLLTLDNSYNNASSSTTSYPYELAFFYDDAVNVYAPVTVSALGYATYAPNVDVDFTGTSINAYKATASGTTVEFTPVNVVPAKTGVLLYADGGASVNVPISTTDADDFSGNKLVRGDGSTSLTYEEGAADVYILSNESAGIGFYKANGNVVSINKAYLDLTGTNAKAITLPNGETDGISSIENGKLHIETSAYNLAGQRVGKNYKGIVIVNGKKMLNK